MAQPYAAELLNLQDQGEQRRFALGELQKQFGAVSVAAAAMPQRRAGGSPLSTVGSALDAVAAPARALRFSYSANLTG